MEPLEEAKWSEELKCVKSLDAIKNAGHCPHDEAPEEIIKLLRKYVSIDKSYKQ